MRGAVEMRFKVGDKVRVLENLTLEDVGRVHDMLEFEGLEASVETVFDQSYHLTVDNHEWYWMDELLEPVEEELEVSNVKFDIPEWVNWLARDENGSIYGYRNKPRKHISSWSIGTVCVDTNTWFVGNNPNIYPQVKWSDEEPKAYKDGITLLNPDELDEIHFYPSEEVPSGKSELDTNEAIIALRNFGNTLTDIEKLRFGLKSMTEIREGTENPPEPDMIQNPPHYKQYSFEPIDIITEVVKEYPPEIGFHIGTTLKYLFRSPFKGKQQEDLSKAEYYLQRANKELIETDNKELTDE